jgi:hypothetical protein
MQAAIKATLRKISGGDRASVDLTGPRGESAHHEFSLIWADTQAWKAVFWSLESHSRDSKTWPKEPDTISKAEELDLFVDGRPSDKRLEVIGSALYQMVFGSEEIRNLLSRLLLQEYDDIPVVQFHILDEGSILQAYPWELLHDGHDFLFDPGRAFIVRYVDFDRPISTIALSGALWVLLVDPRPDMSLHGYTELPLLDRPHLKGLSDQYPGKFEVSDLSTASYSATLTALHRYLMTSPDMHILHVDTHGDYGWLCRCGILNSSIAGICQSQECSALRAGDRESQGYLVLQTKDGNPIWVSGDQLGRQLRNRDVQLVVLSACKSGLVAGSSTFTSMAGALIKRGIPTVVAMQFSVDTQAAEVFVEDFYRALMLGKSLTEAMAEARTGLLAVSDDSWYRPVLYLRTDPQNYRGRIFAPRLSEEAPIILLPQKESIWEVSPTLPSSSEVVRIEVPTGVVPLDSPFYVERDADAVLKQQLERSGAITTIRGARQTGKTSLFVRGVAYARKLGALVILLDFQSIISSSQLVDTNSFLKSLAHYVAAKTQTDFSVVDRTWGSRLSSQDKMIQIIEEVLNNVDGPVVLAMDEVDYLLKTPFSVGFFNLLRMWQRERESVLDSLWRRLSIVIAVSTHPYLLSEDILGLFPLNLSAVIRLKDFTEAQVRDLNQRCGMPLQTEEIPEAMELLGGQPYLIRQALYELVDTGMDWSGFMSLASSLDGPFGDHLGYYLNLLCDDIELRRAMRRVVLKQTDQDKAFRRLIAAGLVRTEGAKYVCRCGLYERCFKDHLHENLPDVEGSFV